MPRAHWSRRAAAAATGVAVAAATLAIASPAAAAPPPVIDTSEFCEEVPAGFGQFRDVTYNAHDIDCLSYTGITAGTAPGMYRPGSPVTRQQMASFIARTADYAVDTQTAGADLQPLPEWDGTNRFPDVRSDEHLAAINRLAQAGIVEGRSEGVYAPTQSVTRDQMASFVNRLQRYLDGEAFTTGEDYFTDVEGNTHEANINGIASVGITQGLSGTSYGPRQVTIRSQMASFIIRYLAVLHDRGLISGATPPDDGDGDGSTIVVETRDELVIANADSEAADPPVASTLDDRVYTASNLDPDGTYRVSLVQRDMIEVAGGVTTFTPRSSARIAELGAVGGRIVAVGGDALPAPTQTVAGVEPDADGELTFTVDAVGFGELIPVVHLDEDGDGLDLDADGRATEPFGLGGPTVTFPEEAPDGAELDGLQVLYHFPALEIVITGTPGTSIEALESQMYFIYRGGDEYTIDGDDADMADFAGAVSPGDGLDVDYRRDDPASSFALDDRDRDGDGGEGPPSDGTPRPVAARTAGPVNLISTTNQVVVDFDQQVRLGDASEVVARCGLLTSDTLGLDIVTSTHTGTSAVAVDGDTVRFTLDSNLTLPVLGLLQGCILDVGAGAVIALDGDQPSVAGGPFTIVRPLFGG